jgi:ubiquinone/menaquinone biosynthesis C-methylase UbiE
MTIYKTATFVETYRAKAAAKDINELSGRTGRPDLTQFVTSQIVKKLPIKADTILVDIGCGDGSLLLKAAEKGLDSREGRLIGILPTSEEVTRVGRHLQESHDYKPSISIQLGLAEKTDLPDNFCDVLVCNGVLLVLQKAETVKMALSEIHRICKDGATVYIGETPDTDEMAGRNYGDSIASWLWWVLKNQGFESFYIRLKQTVRAFFSSEPFIIAPKKLFHMAPDEFIDLMKQHGLDVIEHYRHKETDSTGAIGESKTRWDYIAVKR